MYMYVKRIYAQDSDDEEHYEDLPAPDDGEADEQSSSESSDSEDEGKGANPKSKSSWVHKNLKNSGTCQELIVFFTV